MRKGPGSYLIVSARKEQIEEPKFGKSKSSIQKAHTSCFFSPYGDTHLL